MSRCDSTGHPPVSATFSFSSGTDACSKRPSLCPQHHRTEAEIAKECMTLLQTSMLHKKPNKVDMTSQLDSQWADPMHKAPVNQQLVQQKKGTKILRKELCHAVHKHLPLSNGQRITAPLQSDRKDLGYLHLY
jgi:hypothetical protein